jgi:phospholipase C
MTGEKHIADIIKRIERSPLWPSTAIIVTYDENGGFWDHAAPPQGDRWGPGTRIPAIIISPFARWRGFPPIVTTAFPSRIMTEAS